MTRLGLIRPESIPVDPLKCQISLILYLSPASRHPPPHRPTSHPLHKHPFHQPEIPLRSPKTDAAIMLANRTANLLVRRQIARGGNVVAGQSFSSASAAVMDDAPSPPSNNIDTSKPPHNVYMWGTSKKGTIPINLLQESATASSSSSGGMFSGDEIIIDHPVKLNLQQVDTFLFGNDDNNDNKDDDDAILDRIYCGASGTAMVLNDGRCFVMGSNKNGELG